MSEFECDERRAKIAEQAASVGAAVASASFRTDIDVETKSGKTDVVTQADHDAQAAVVDEIRSEYPDEPIVGEEEPGSVATEKNDGNGPASDRSVRKAVPSNGPAWIVDPIDGTNNFVRGIPVFGTAVAAVIDGEPVGAAVVLPALEDTYTTESAGTRLNDELITVSDRTDPTVATVGLTMWWGYDERERYASAVRALVTRFNDIRRVGSAQATLSMVASGALDGALVTESAHPWDTVAGVHLIRGAGGTVTDLDGNPWRHDSVGLVASNGMLHDSLLSAGSEVATQ